MKIVILAGGTGSRLWPVSRMSKPKQFHALFGEKTLLQQTYERACAITDKENIFVSTNKEFAHLVEEQLPDVAPDRIIREPAKRDSGPARGLESMIIEKKYPGEIVLGLPSDHYVENLDNLVRVVYFGEAFLKTHPEHIVCVGIRPSFPSTALGYIQMGEEVAREKDIRLFRVAAFHEKPEAQTARTFYRDWRYLWNANYFMWRPAHILRLIERYAPETFEKLSTIQQSLGTPEFEKTLGTVFPTITPEAIDYMIMEKNDQMVVIPADIGWKDIGVWKVLGEIENTATSQNRLDVDTKNVVIVADQKKLIATIGLENIVIIDTPDALLVCDKDRSGEVKQLVEKMKEDTKLDRYL